MWGISLISLRITLFRRDLSWRYSVRKRKRRNRKLRAAVAAESRLQVKHHLLAAANLLTVSAVSRYSVLDAKPAMTSHWEAIILYVDFQQNTGKFDSTAYYCLKLRR